MKKSSKYWMLVPFWFPYILEMVTAIKNLLAYSSWKINSLHTKTDKPILTPLGFLFHSWTLHQQTTIFIDPSNEHSYQVWFQLAQRFQSRKLKTNITLFDTVGPFVSFMYFWLTKIYKYFRGSFNEHSYQIWFQFAVVFFQGRKFKTDNTLFCVSCFFRVLSINNNKHINF